MFRSVRMLGIATAITFALAGPALAHAHLVSAIPQVNGIAAASPSELDLKFTEGLNLKFTGVKVTGPGNVSLSTGMAKLGVGDDTTLIVPVSGTLAAGTYKVDWHALSTDGHKTQGSYTFTVKP